MAGNSGRKTAIKAAKAAKKAGEKAASGTKAAIEDKELRANVDAVLAAAKTAHNHVTRSKGPNKKLLNNKKLKRSLDHAGEALVDACKSMGVKPGKKRSRVVMGAAVLGAGGAAAVGLSPGLREKTLSTLFGKEQEFDYSSTTEPPEA